MKVALVALGLVAWAVLPISSLILGLGGINVLLTLGLLVSWLIWPTVGPSIYTATWINLVAYRLVLTRSGTLATTFPVTVNNQNGIPSWLMMVGIAGAARSGFFDDTVGIALGVIG